MVFTHIHNQWQKGRIVFGIQLNSSGAQFGESCRVCTGQYFILFLFPVAMEHLHKSNQIPILLLMGIFYATKAAFVENLYRKLEPEQNITGQIGAEHKEISHIECSTM